MALAQRLEIADHEARLAAGNFDDGPYGSLLGSRMSRPRKKPVLVLDADELAEARVAMAMGGAQIMEEADDPLAAERRPMPSMLLGLAPIDADDEWEPEIAPAALAEVPSAPADAFDPDAEEFDPEATETGWAEEAEPHPPPATPAFDLPILADEADEEEDSLPTIEEQLARMRRATAAPKPQSPLAQQPTAIERLGDVWPSFAPPAPTSAPRPVPQIAWDEAETPASAQIEPVQIEPTEIELPPEPEERAEDEAVFDLPVEAMVAQDDWAHTEEPEPDGPDLAWMMPPEPRQLHIEEGAHNSLRAHLLRDEAEAVEEAAPSLWDRLREWVARLLSRR